MYRQIVVHPDDRPLQQIVWRNDPSEPMKAYQLNTVTYGTASAPYLATRCLKQIGMDCKDDKISEIIIHYFYVDDLLTGGDSIQDALDIHNKVSSELATAGMNLRKWKSNEPRVILNNNNSSLDLNIGSTEPCKTLGLSWQIESDELYFSTSEIVLNNFTKRGLLSVISQIFDPLGLLTLCIISMKILMQKLWLLKLTWDEQLPSEIIKLWLSIVENLSFLNNLRIPRSVICNQYINVDLHIFSDASQVAYGACLYVRSSNNKNNVMVRLFSAKSRVAPIRPTTIPRLELCAALVGVRLYEKVISSLRIQVRSVIFWSDSTIVLGWLKMLPNKLQPFVRNRVAEILEKTGSFTWRHVPTDLNPADYVSRGTNINQIHNLDLWWSGPQFLKGDMSSWPANPIVSDKLPETRSEISLVVTDQKKPLIGFERFSNFIRLQRSMAYVLRFINICKKKPVQSKFLSNDELHNSLNTLIRLSQIESFEEYVTLYNNKKLPSKCTILKFNPFLDENKIMSVGGRLGNALFTYEKKHPIMLQSTNRFTKLLFKYMHVKLLHAGPRLLLASIREMYWPIGGLKLAKYCYRQCYLCCRYKGRVINPLMGNLPQGRVTPGGFPFESVGVDYAGPIMSASRQGRGCKLTKVYILIFVCFATKAVHVELTGDLTSNNYLSALRRFISRRGKPKHIYSDNGTSFVGAYNEIGRFIKDNCNSLSENLAQENINFHFIPPQAPHFGGLWEAGVKSIKYHLRRILGNCNLTYEELNTVLVQIEGVLNSRPLTPLSTDPDDLLPLTPGHFLIGRPINSLPSQNYEEVPSSRLSRYQRIQQLRQHFWRRWSKEYLSELQQRSKWRSNADTLGTGDLVVLKEDNLPPLKWRLGRITAFHPGADGINRVADIRTATGIVRRPFCKICPLPNNKEG
ncbi:unnamed protein product [Parnassius mnemosyne]|uniref:Integrase catalytic domain-containing protein n=1 Tax=Parnassius mnemosyne TaxID=213953 RepID=A0AAV1L425_9NEOP